MKDFTVKEIADLLEVSKTTVQKYAKAAAIKCDYKKNNKQFYCYEKTKIIIKTIRNDFDFSILENETEIANSQAETANSQAETANQSASPQTETANSQAETANSQTTERMLDMLQKEIEKKDQMIHDLQEKLDRAYDKIADMAGAAQYITAADKTAAIMDKQQKEKDPEEIVNTAATPEPIQEEKKGFFSRLFRRN